MREPTNLSLLIDLYEVTMAEAYLGEQMDELAVFELFFRDLPPNRNYVLFCGLEDVLAFLEDFAFTPDDIAYLATLRAVDHGMLERLAALRFTGTVNAAPEGTVVFPGEPVVQVIAPVAQAQLVETFVMNQVHLQSVLATKAARVVTAAAGRTVVDFGARRTAGVDAALKLARGSYIAGAAGTSNLLAGRTYGIPVLGTMAHSYIQAHDGEAEAFRLFTSRFPETTLLVDTYDTLAGVQEVVHLARKLGAAFRVRAIRLDSGDLETLSHRARDLLDAAGLRKVKIFASGGLDEIRISALLAAGAPIDGFGVGTRLGVSQDAPTLDLAYKLVEYGGRGRVKTSPEKELVPGRKQVWRTRESGVMMHDVVGRADETLAGEPLLQTVMQDGQRLDGACPPLAQIRERAQAQLASLPARLRQLAQVDPYPVRLSDRLAAERDAVREQALRDEENKR